MLYTNSNKDNYVKNIISILRRVSYLETNITSTLSKRLLLNSSKEPCAILGKTGNKAC